MKKFIVGVMLVAVLAASGYAYYAFVYLPSQVVAATEAPLQTATVRRGDISITAQGAGTLVPAAQLDLGFGTSGVLTELHAAVGDRVIAGQVLAKVNDTEAQMQLTQAELNLAQAEDALASLTSPMALAAAELEVVNKQATLTTAQATLKSLLAPDLTYYAEALAKAQRDYNTAAANQELVSVGSQSQEKAVQDAQKNMDTAYQKWQDNSVWYGPDHNKTTDAKAAYEIAKQDLAAAKLKLGVATSNQQANVETAQAALTTAQANYAAALHYTPDTSRVALAQANAKVAEADLIQTQAKLAELKGEPLPSGATSSLASARNQVEQAKLTLENAKRTLAATTLTAPISGTITAVNAVVGQSVGAAALLTLADLDHAQILFYVDETDVGYIDIGYPVSVVFDAAPDVPYSGTVLAVDPALVTVGNSPVVRAWAQIDLKSNPAVRILSGMNATVEVTAGEARDALLVPVQALRELTPTSYAVFVIQSDGKLKLTPVTVGLKDFANAEIKTGLQTGQVVSTGIVETQQ